MISTSSLTANLIGDWVAFDERGEPLRVDIPPTIGPAAFLVSEVTDAVKRVADGVVRSLDRDQLWAVEAIVLNRVVLPHLGEAEMTVDELIESVRRAGFAWQISPVASP